MKAKQKTRLAGNVILLLSVIVAGMVFAIQLPQVSAQQSNIAGETLQPKNIFETRMTDIRNGQTSSIDKTKSSQLTIVLFLSSSDKLAAIKYLPFLKNLTDSSATAVISENFVFVRSPAQAASEVAKALPFSLGSRLFLDSDNAMERAVHIPDKTPFGIVIEGEARHVTYLWGPDVDPRGPLSELAKWEEQRHNRSKE